MLREICLHVKRGLVWGGVRDGGAGVLGMRRRHPRSPGRGRRTRPSRPGRPEARPETWGAAVAAVRPPSPDTGTPGNPVAEPPMGLNGTTRSILARSPATHTSTSTRFARAARCCAGSWTPVRRRCSRNATTSATPIAVTMTRGKPMQEGVRVEAAGRRDLG